MAKSSSEGRGEAQDRIPPAIRDRAVRRKHAATQAPAGAHDFRGGGSRLRLEQVALLKQSGKAHCVGALRER